MEVKAYGSFLKQRPDGNVKNQSPSLNFALADSGAKRASALTPGGDGSVDDPIGEPCSAGTAAPGRPVANNAICAQAHGRSVPPRISARKCFLCRSPTKFNVNIGKLVNNWQVTPFRLTSNG